MNSTTPTPLDGTLFGDAPARDDRFVVKDHWVECTNLPNDHPLKQVEFLHRQMNEEMNGLEMAARSLADFPGAEWEIRMWIARQCADEARHVLMFRRMCEKCGGRVGEYPVMNFQYRIVTKIDNLIGRLAVQNRSFEASGIDAVTLGIEEARGRGDMELAEFFEAQQADEIVHVRFANEWIRDAVRKEPRNALRMAAALTAASKAFLQVMGPEGTKVRYQIDSAGRFEAGFELDEVKVAANAMAKRSRSRQEAFKVE